MKISESGVRFIAAHEGFVSKSYLCPSGVRTIGYGFTMASKIFASYWRSKYGRSLQMGDTITKTEADKLLRQLIDSEYGSAVNQQIGTKVQHQYDAASSVSFNCGTGSLAWVWAQRLKSKDIKGSANRLRTTAVTANGRRLAGLVRRRDEEATLIETGRYAGSATSVPQSMSSSKSAVKEYQQQLVSLGYDTGGVDGIAGAKTIEAVRSFQKANGLVSDGIVGPATRAALIRALDTKIAGKAAGGAGTIGGAGGVAASSDPASLDAVWSAALWGLGALVVVGIAVLAVKYRGVITGRRVPT